MNPSYVVSSWTAADGSRAHDVAASLAPAARTPSELDAAVKKAIRVCQRAKGTGLRVQVVDSLTGAKYTLLPKAIPATPMTTLRCCVCDSSDWISGAPGTAPDAKSYDVDKVVDIRPADPEPQRVWCAKCAPWLRGRRRNGRA